MQVRLAERVATALTSLHKIHVIHAAICPAALRVSPNAEHSTGHDNAAIVEGACSPPTSSHDAPAIHTFPSSKAIAQSLKSMHFKNRHQNTGGEIPPQDIRVMLSEFSAACALAPPDYSIPNHHIREALTDVATRYAPPERRAEGKALTKQSDMYSWAATMYHLMTCQHPCVTESACIKGIPSSIVTGGDKMDSTERASGVPKEVCVSPVVCTDFGIMFWLSFTCI